MTLRRTPMVRRHRNTGPTPAQRNLVLERAGGCCELCGLLLHDGIAWARAHSFHHRLPRRAGGSRLAALNLPSNIMLLCGTGTTGCHGKVEDGRAVAYAHGWLLRSGADPAATAVDITAFHVLVFLTEDGEYRVVAP